MGVDVQLCSGVSITGPELHRNVEKQQIQGCDSHTQGKYTV